METFSSTTRAWNMNVDVTTPETVDINIEEKGTLHNVSAAISIIICVIGTLANFLAIFVNCTLKEYRKSATYWYILQLAIADSLFLLTLPFKVSQEIHKSWIFPEWMCKTKETILFLNYYGSVLFLTIMSLDRYAVVCQTFSPKWKKLRTQTSTVIITLAVWAIALLICIPVMMFSFVEGNEPNCICAYTFPDDKTPEESCQEENFRHNSTYHRCVYVKMVFRDKKCFRNEHYELLNYYDYENYDDYQYNEYEYNYDENYTMPNSSIEGAVLNSDCHYFHSPRSFIVFLLFNSVAMFFLPLLVMFVCYGLIVARLSSSRPHIDVTSDGSSYEMSSCGSSDEAQKKKTGSSPEKDRKRATIMCGIFVVTFLCCWLPFHAVHLAKIDGIPHASTALCQGLSKVGSLLVFLNSAVNPFLYNFLGRSFKRRLRTAWATFQNFIRKQMKRLTFSSNDRRQYKSNQDGNRENDFETTISPLTRCADETIVEAFNTTSQIDAKASFQRKANNDIALLLNTSRTENTSKRENI